MSPAAILAPVFVQVALTFALLFALGQARWDAARAGRITFKDIALGQNNWPERPAKIGRAYHNQLEAPVLFYAVVAMALAANLADRVFLVLEWLFVAARLAHAYVHVGSNHVPTRFRVFVVGFFVLIALWLWLALRAFALV